MEDGPVRVRHSGICACDCAGAPAAHAPLNTTNRVGAASLGVISRPSSQVPCPRSVTRARPACPSPADARRVNARGPRCPLMAAPYAQTLNPQAAGQCNAIRRRRRAAQALAACGQLSPGFGCSLSASKYVHSTTYYADSNRTTDSQDEHERCTAVALA